MSAKKEQQEICEFWQKKCVKLLQSRNNLTQEDFNYAERRISGFKDTKLRGCLRSVIGWGEEERAELETFCAIALELMKTATPSRLRDAARLVEMRFYVKNSK